MSIKQKIKDYINEILGDKSVVVPESIIDFWATNYGQQVNKTMVDNSGNNWRIDRVLTVDAEEDVNITKTSWRNNVGAEELDYSVPYLESILSNWVENDKLIPLLAINSNETACYDLVVINLFHETLKLSVWVHDDNIDMDEPVLYNIAESVDDFLIQWNQG
jgi:hypothetical protein